MIRPNASLRFRVIRALLAGLFLFGGSCLFSVEDGQAAPRLQGVELEVQGFEDLTFPPPNWEAVDMFVDSGQPPNFTWGRETCETAPGGGNAIAWAVRGGAAGQQLGCLDPYTGFVSSILRYGPIDTLPYPGGLEVNMLFKLDAPTAQSFTICAEGVDTTYGCFGTGIEETDWATFPQPGMIFQDAGSKAEVWVEFRYSGIAEDPPSHYGALIDEVVIRGRGGSAPTPTTGPTATTGPTSTTGPTATASSTPTTGPTATASSTPTMGPTRPPTLTPRPTNSPTPSATATATDVPPTATSSATSTATVPATATVTPSVTPTDSPATATSTRTATASASSTSAPTASATLAPSATFTALPTSTATQAPLTPTSPAPVSTPSPSPTPPVASATPSGPEPGTPTSEATPSVPPEGTPSPPPLTETPDATATEGLAPEPEIYLPFCVVRRG